TRGEAQTRFPYFNVKIKRGMKKTKIIHTPVGMRFKAGMQRDSGPQRVQYKKPSQKASLKARFSLPRKNPQSF
ncbi:MAG: hypothetical protein AAB946_01290, partial [Patescibacteria group bacterium]